MVYIDVEHTVKDYARWREGFDGHAAAREAAGGTNENYVMRSIQDPNQITVLLGWSDLDKARAFTKSASLKEAMQNAGVIGSPKVRFLESVN